MDKILEIQCTEYDDPVPDFPLIEHIDNEKLDRLRDLAKGWFAEGKAREKISKLLDGYKIDDVEIETAIIKEPPKEMEALDRAIATLEFRRDKALKCIFDYRREFADKIKQVADKIIDGETADAPRLDHKVAKKAVA